MLIQLRVPLFIKAALQHDTDKVCKCVLNVVPIRSSILLATGVYMCRQALLLRFLVRLIIPVCQHLLVDQKYRTMILRIRSNG